MKNIGNVFIFCSLFAFFMYSCQNNPGNNKIEPVNTDQFTSKISKSIPPQLTEKVHPGKAVYAKYCLACHQSDGSGVPNMHPPLGPGTWVEKNPKELVAIMMKGLSGKIEVNGEEYKNYMPSQAKLTDEEIADVLSFIRSSFGNNLEPVPSEMVAKIRSGH